MSQFGVPCSVVVRVSAVADAQHLCPFKDEVDHGTVRVEWTTTDQTLELHTLAALIGSRAQERVSHEEWTADLAARIATEVQVEDLVVTSRWRTAGIDVEVRAPGGAS